MLFDVSWLSKDKGRHIWDVVAAAVVLLLPLIGSSERQLVCGLASGLIELRPPVNAGWPVEPDRSGLIVWDVLASRLASLRHSGVIQMGRCS